MSKQKLKKAAYIIAAFALAFLMGVEGPTQIITFALDPDQYLNQKSPVQLEEELKKGNLNGNIPGATKLYISDLMIGTGDTPEQAKKAIHDKGYLVYDGNMNQGTNTDKCSYLGYKLTTKRENAITDIRAMDESGGYLKLDYLKFAENQMDGLPELLINMRDACEELRDRYDQKVPSAVAAMNYLNLFTVPYTASSEVEREEPETGKGEGSAEYITEDTSVEPVIEEKLGDYLIMHIDQRTDRALKILEICTDPLMLNIINGQIALGLSDSTLRSTRANGGETADGKVSGTFTSSVGVTGYTKLVDDPDWIKNAVKKMLADENLGTVDTKKSVYWAQLKKDYGAQAELFDLAVKEGRLSSAATAYLKSVIPDSQSKLAAICGVTSTVTAYDFLTLAPARYRYAFFSNLPEVCGKFAFADVLEICATDHRHRLPAELVYDRVYDNNIATGMINNITQNLYWITNSESRAQKATTVATVRSEIERFAVALQSFFPPYEEAMAAYRSNGDAVDISDVDTSEEKMNESLQNNSTGEVNDLYYVGVHDTLTSFKINDSTGKYRDLAEYLKAAYTAYENKDTELAYAMLYPVVTSISDGQRFIFKTNDLLTVFLNMSIGREETRSFENALDSMQLELEEDFESEVFSVWTGGCRRLIESDEKVYFTNEDARRTAAENGFGDVFKNEKPLTDKMKTGLITVGGIAAIVAGAALLTVFIAGATMGGAGALTMALTAIVFYTTMGCTALGTVATMVSVIAAFGGLIALALLALTAIILAIIYAVASMEHKPDQYTVMPTILFDDTTVLVDKDENGNELPDDQKTDKKVMLAYYLIRDQYGKVADVNCFEGMKWTALYYTKDTNAGSPLTAGKAPTIFGGAEDSFFAHRTGSDQTPDLAYPLCKFGQLEAFNLNTNCLKDKCNGIYFFFFTEDSLAGKPRTTLRGKYISGLKIAYAANTRDGMTGAKAYINRMEGYNLIDVNLSPDADFCTYMGYATTNNAQYALTDIRVSYGSTAASIQFGDVTYNNISEAKANGETATYYCPAKTCEDKESSKKDTDFSYAIYYTTSSLAGSPILSEDIGVINSLNDLKDGYETIQVFSGGHFNFNAWDHEKYDYFYNHKYVYFSPEKKYKSTDPDVKRYIGGLAFYSGSEDWLSPDDTREYTLKRFAEFSADGTVIDWNLTPSLLNNPADVTYLAYYTTFNPKRAITEIGSFTGEAKNGYLPNAIVSAGIGYEACQVYTQGDWNYYGKGGSGKQRIVRRSHAYFSIIESEINDYDWPENTFVFPRGLYVAGPQAGVSPLTIGDIVISDAGPTDTGAGSLTAGGTPSYQKILESIPDAYGTNAHMYYLNGAVDRTPVNAALGTGWKSVHPLEQYFYDSYDANGNLTSRYNLGLGMNRTSDTSGNGNLFIYYKNGTPDRIRGNYISAANIVGSAAANASFDTARIAGMSTGQEILNLDKPMRFYTTDSNEALKECPTRYNHKKKEYTKYVDGYYYVAVSYTNLEKDSIGYIRILEQEAGKELGSSQKLPLSLGSAKTAFKKGTLAELPYGEGSSVSAEKRAGYVMYTTNNCTGINRLMIKELALVPKGQTATYWGDNKSVVAEYYVPVGTGYDPFVFENRVDNVGYCIAMQRYDVTGREDKQEKYISGINVVKDITYDGTVHRAAAALGTRGYPYVVDWDISEGRLEGTNQVIALAVTRTTQVKQALKDIKISSVDLGPKVTFDSMIYNRQNDVSATDGIPNTEDVFIYATTGQTDHTLIDWADVDYENTDWEKFDWYHLDPSTALGKDSWSAIYDHELSPELMSKIDRYFASRKAQGDSLTSWSTKYAITNLGVEPSVDSARQSLRKVNGTAKTYYWAGASADREIRLLTPMSSGTSVLTASTFDGSVSTLNLVYTNLANNAMPQYGEDDDAGGSLPASVFTRETTIITLAVFALVSVLALCGAYVLKKRKKIFVKATKEEL